MQYNQSNDWKKLFLSSDENDYMLFYSRISPIIKNIIAKKIPTKDCDDVLQESLISIHKAQHTYDGNRPFMPWLLSIVFFRINDYLRNYYRNKQYSYCDVADIENIADNVTNYDDNNELLDELLLYLSQDEQKICRLLYEDGLTFKETSEIIGIKEVTIKVKIHRLFKKLRRKLEA